MKIIDSIWFEKTGIVKVDNGYETKWYIGIGKGNNKELDERIIMTAGIPVYPKMLQEFFKSVKEVQKEEELEAIRLEHLAEINKIINKQKDVDNSDSNS